MILVGKAGAYPMEPFRGLHSKGRLQTLLPNIIRLGCKLMEVANTLSFFYSSMIFVGKAGAHPNGAFLFDSTLRVGSKLYFHILDYYLRN